MAKFGEELFLRPDEAATEREVPEGDLLQDILNHNAGDSVPFLSEKMFVASV